LHCRYVSSFLQATKALRESRGIAPICIYTSALGGGEGSASRPGRILPLGKTRYPLYRMLGGPQGRSGQVRKISPHRDFFTFVRIVYFLLFWYWTKDGMLQRLRSGANPRSLVPEASTQTPRPPKPLFDPRTVQPVASRYTD
jgi:hypothetical protein